MIAFIKGILISFSLIVSIGPQNAFVIKQGIKKEKAFLTAFMVTLCDSILIILGILGVGKFLSGHFLLRVLLTCGGIVFLGIYGIKAILRICKDQGIDLNLNKHQRSSKEIIFLAISFSWLNPHAILDTLIILGSISSNYNTNNSIFFGLGAIFVSTIWFFLLVLVSKTFSKYLQKPITWKVIDIIIGIVCLWIAANIFKKSFIDIERLISMIKHFFN